LVGRIYGRKRSLNKKGLSERQLWQARKLVAPCEEATAISVYTLVHPHSQGAIQPPLVTAPQILRMETRR
jgi:hypothetical protein